MLPKTSNKTGIEKTSKKYFPSIEFRLIVIAMFLLLSVLSNKVFAFDQESISVFVVKESNHQDSIIGFGVSTLHKLNNTDMGISFETSLSNADVVDIQGYEQSYLAWELGAKFGYFSKMFIYAEFGFDFGELAFQDRNEDSDYDSNRSNSSEGYYFHEAALDLRFQVDDYSNDIDAYVGVASGINLGQIQLTAFARYRQIDGEFWKADNQTFTGVKASISF